MSQHSGEPQPDDRAAADTRGSWVELVAQLRDELEELRARDRAHDEGPGAPPPPPEPDVARGDLLRLTEQIDALRGTLADRFDAMPDVDLRPVHDRLDRLAQQVATLRVPDLAPLLERIGPQAGGAMGGGASATDLRPVLDRLDRLHQQLSALSVPDLRQLREQIDQLTHAVGSFSGADAGAQQGRLDRLAQQVAGLPRADQIAAAIAPQLDAVRSALRPDAVLEALDASTAAVQERLVHAVDVTPALREALGPLTTRLDQLAASEQVVRDDLGLATEVLAGLTQVHEVTEHQLTELLEGRSSAEAEQRALRDSFTELARSLTTSARQLENQLGALVARMTAFEDSVGAHLAGAIERIKDETRERVEEQLRGLGMPQLRTSIDELVQQVVDGRAENREVLDALATLVPPAGAVADGVVVEQGATSVDLSATDLRHSLSSLIQHVVDGRAEARDLLAAVETIDERLAAIEKRPPAPSAPPLPPPPQPQLAEIAAGLDRLQESLLGTDRPEPATAEDLDVVRQGLAATLGTLDRRITEQAEAVSGVVDRLAELDPAAGREETASAIARMADELTATRDALAQRTGSRRRWRGSDDAPGVPVAPERTAELEERIEGIALGMDERLVALTAQVERAAEYSIEAAAAAKAALAGVTRNLLAPPPPPPPPPPPAVEAAAKAPAAKKAPAKRAAAKTTAAKKTAAKKTPATKGSPASTPGRKVSGRAAPPAPPSPDPAPPGEAPARSQPPRSS